MRYKEAIQLVRDNRTYLDIRELAEVSGITERFLTLCLDGATREGRPVVVSMALRKRFIEVVLVLHHDILLFCND